MIQFFPARLPAAVPGVCLAVAACLATSTTAWTAEQSAKEKGLKIALESRARGEGFGNFTARQAMVLRNKQGRESKRQVRIKVFEVAGDGNKSLFVFDQPRNVKGTAFLVHGRRAGPDDQWLYLPALKRVKRISSSNRSGSFMGSEFAYEDMGSQEVERYTYKYLRDEPCGESTCTVTERFPTDKKSGYSRQLVWQDKDELRVWKTQFFDRKNTHLKTLTMKKYEKYLDRYWQAHEMEMVNHVTGKSTLLTWSEFKFRTDLTERDFTKTGLKRVR